MSLFSSYGGCQRQPSRKAPVRDSFPRQRVVCHRSEYEPTALDRAAVADGLAFLVDGKCLAKVSLACRIMGSNEIMFYYLHREGSPIVEEVFFPRQRVSPYSCEVAAEDVIQAAREIKRLGFSVFSAGHSHGHSRVFTSQTDRSEEKTLLLEKVARVTEVTERIGGTVREIESAGGPPAVLASFPGRPIGVEIAWRKGPVAAEDVEVTLLQTRRRAVSSFSTSNAKGEHLVPGLAVTTCPVCGTSTEEEISPADITVHVIGPVALAPGDREAVRAELEERVTKSWSSGYSGTSYGRRALPAPAAATPGEQGWDRPSGPSPFSVWRHGRYVATIEAEVLEEAAAKVPALKRALGWNDGEELSGERR